MSRRIWAVLALAVVLFSWQLGGHDLWAPDEPYFGEGAREMVVDGEWLVPHVNGVVLPSWVIDAVSVHVATRRSIVGLRVCRASSSGVTAPGGGEHSRTAAALVASADSASRGEPDDRLAWAAEDFVGSEWQACRAGVDPTSLRHLSLSQIGLVARSLVGLSQKTAL